MSNPTPVAIIVVDDFNPYYNKYDLGEGKQSIVDDRCGPFIVGAGLYGTSPVGDGGYPLPHGHIVYGAAQNELTNYGFELKQTNAAPNYSFTDSSNDSVKLNVAKEELWEREAEEGEDSPVSPQKIWLIGLDIKNYKPEETFQQVRRVIETLKNEKGINHFVVNMSFVLVPNEMINEWINQISEEEDDDNNNILKSAVKHALTEERIPLHPDIIKQLPEWRSVRPISPDHDCFRSLVEEIALGFGSEPSGLESGIVTDVIQVLSDHANQEEGEEAQSKVEEELVTKIAECCSVSSKPNNQDRIDFIRKNLVSCRNDLFYQSHFGRDSIEGGVVTKHGDLITEHILKHFDGEIQAICVGGAGNLGGRGYHQPLYPARWNSVVAVSAREDGAKAAYSNDGDVMFDGHIAVHQTATLYSSQQIRAIALQGAAYGGTSYAAPQFSVFAAVYFLLGGETENHAPVMAYPQNGQVTWNNETEIVDAIKIPETPSDATPEEATKLMKQQQQAQQARDKVSKVRNQRNNSGNN